MWNALVVAIYLPVAVGAAAWIVWRDGADGARAALIGATPAVDLALGAAVGLGVVLGSRLAALVGWGARMERAMARTIGPVSFGTCLVLAVASSVGEELLFRGVLQPAIGLVATSLLFALAHVPVDRDLALWPTFALAVGLLMGGLAEHTGALVAPVACHFLINLLNLRRLATVARQLQEDDGTGFFQ